MPPGRPATRRRKRHTLARVKPGQRFEPGQKLLIEDLVGLAVERTVLGAFDPASRTETAAKPSKTA